MQKRRQDTKNMLDRVNIVKSQQNGEFYDKLKREGRWDRFVAVVQLCQKRNLSVDDTVGVILKTFPGYINKVKFNRSAFERLIRDFPELQIAWGYGDLGDDVTDIQIKNKAVDLVMKSDNINDIKTFTEIYGSTLQINKGDSGEDQEDTHKTTFNFNIVK